MTRRKPGTPSCRTVHSYPGGTNMDLALEIMDVVDVLPTCHA